MEQTLDGSKKTERELDQEELERLEEEEREAERRIEEAERNKEQAIRNLIRHEADLSQIVNPAVSVLASTAPIPPTEFKRSVEPFTTSVSVLEPEKKKGKGETPPQTSEEKAKAEVNAFIDEFNLSPLLPPGFGDLKDAQKLKVIRDLKRRIVDIVKSDAQTQYSEYLKKLMVGTVDPKSNIIMRKLDTVQESIEKSFTKEADLKNFEKGIFLELRNTEEGRKFVAADFEMLVANVKDRKVSIAMDGSPCFEYLSENTVNGEVDEVAKKFNIAANEFAYMPYEWGQESGGVKVLGKKIGGKHKKEYEKAKTEYEKARNAILEIKEREANPENKGNATLEMLEIDNALQMEQLINTHPEFEKTLNDTLHDFERSADGREKLKTAKNFLNTLTGKNWWNRGLTGLGFAIRMGAKGATLYTGATMCTALGAPIAGGVIGGLRGRKQAKDTLSESQKQARHGQENIKDNSEKAKKERKGRVAMVNAEHLTKRLEDLVNEIENKVGWTEMPKKLAILTGRIEHTQGKIEKGQVNFGNARDALCNQFNLINNLNKALILKESMHSLHGIDADKTLKENIDSMLKVVGEGIALKTSEAQKTFIRKQALRGAAMGAGFATVGYVARGFGEHMGWWGEHGTGKISNNHAEKIEEARRLALEKDRAAKLAEKVARENARIAREETERLQKLAEEQALEAKRLTDEQAQKLAEQAEEAKKLAAQNTPVEQSSAPEKLETLVTPETIPKTEPAIPPALTSVEPQTPTETTPVPAHPEPAQPSAPGQPITPTEPRIPTPSGKISEDQELAALDESKSGTPSIPHVQEPTAPTQPDIPPTPKVTQEIEEKVAETSAGQPDTHQISTDPTKWRKFGEKYEPDTTQVETSAPEPTPEPSVVEPVAIPKSPSVEEIRESIIKKMNPEELPPETNPENTVSENLASVEKTNQILDMLQTHPEFARNPSHLEIDKLMEAYEVHEQNIAHIFRGNEALQTWNEMKNLKASKLFESKDYINYNTKVPILNYLHELRYVTNLKPKGWSIFGRAETVNEYIARALQKASKDGSLDKLKASSFK